MQIRNIIQSAALSANLIQNAHSLQGVRQMLLTLWAVHYGGPLKTVPIRN